MKWLSTEETKARIERLHQPELLFQIYALSLFADDVFYAPDFVPSDDWCETVALSSAGKELLSDLHKTGIKFSEPIEHFILLRLFYHRDLFIDYENTDASRLLNLLNGIHKSGRGKWPYVYGNLLYHKFNDIYEGNRTETLDPESAGMLLSDTPQGVFQVGTILSGPFGFVESAEQRTIPPTLRLPLWHCSDPGCQARHFVILEQHRNECKKALNTFVRHVLDNLGRPSEWARALLGIYRRGKWPNGRPYYDLPAVVGDCIIGRDREVLCVRALRSPHNLRLSAVIREAKNVEGSPEKITSALSPEEQHQLLLLLTDKDIVNLVDELLCRKEIRIPPSELRNPKTYTYGHVRDNDSQLSSLGIRSTGHPPIIELSALIWNAYKELGITDDLSWRVRGHIGTSLRHSVMEFIRSHGPKAGVKELILPSRDVTSYIGEYLTFQIFPKEDEDATCTRLLWKFGFNLARYEDEYFILRNRIAQFRDRVLQMPPQPNEDERARIRSIGVNLFVSVEQFLENILCYNVWLLTSDHFTGTNFCFSKQEAESAVLKVLGAEIKSGDESLKWSAEGANTLGALLAYLQAFRNWLKERPNTDNSAINRNQADYPHYSSDTLWIFPFEHTQLWADTDPRVMAEYVDLFDKVCIQIAQADLPSVRNGLDHWREENAFPEADKMLACVSRLQQVVDIADSKRLIPKLFWGVKEGRDADGNICYTFADYRDVSVSIWEPSPVFGGPKKSIGIPYLIAPFDFLNLPNSMLVFLVSPRTEYQEYWKNYPRRRIIPQNVHGDVGEVSSHTEGEPADAPGCLQFAERAQSAQRDRATGSS